jgi:solute carrier family 25 (mitochondrial S-adenosylmethionine transporter), member 26
LDTLKTRIQSPNYKTLYKTIPKPSQPTNTSLPQKPIPLTASSLLSRHTHFNPSLFRGLYQGIGTVIFVTIPSSGAFFTTYEALKYTLSDANPPNSTLYLPQPAIHALSSGGAELVSCAILTPAEVLKQNAQVFNQNQPKDGEAGGKVKPRTSPTIAVLKQFRQHPTKLFRGYTALAARNLPFTGLQFPIFEHLKGYFLDRRKQKKLQLGLEEGGKVDGILERARITALSAALAGTVAAWITTPIDVLKTRIMLGAGDEAKYGPNLPGNGSGKRQTALALTKHILKIDGIRGMFRGALLRSLWTAFGSGLYLGCYEGGRHYLEERRRDRNQSGGDVLMEKERDWKGVKVGIGASRSQGAEVGKSGWQE